MKVQELMTRDVISVETGTSLKAVAGLLAKNRISGVPVCDDEGRVLGVVSEADIVTKEEGYAPRRIGFLGWLFAPPPELAKKLDARTAGEAMTSPPVTIDPGARVSQAARVMADRNVNRLPVVREGALIGIITRGDLVRAFLRPDGEIREEILDDVLKRTLWIDRQRVEVEVVEGRVSLSGKLDCRTEAEMVEGYVRLVPGVVEVDSKLTWEVDDLSRRTSRVAGQ